ncbi:hypothetical protein A3Q37_02668 [Streptomyces sp. PTY087I2]|nr:hypothetical protein A3Q37_02668 [Streptomyces sp. PTY087I2]
MPLLGMGAALGAPFKRSATPFVAPAAMLLT